MIFKIRKLISYLPPFPPNFNVGQEPESFTSWHFTEVAVRSNFRHITSESYHTAVRWSFCSLSATFCSPLCPLYFAYQRSFSRWGGGSRERKCRHLYTDECITCSAEEMERCFYDYKKKNVIIPGTAFEVFMPVQFDLYLSASPCACQVQPFLKYGLLADRKKKCWSLLSEAEEAVFLWVHIFLQWWCKVKEKLFWNTQRAAHFLKTDYFRKEQQLS